MDIQPIIILCSTYLAHCSYYNWSIEKSWKIKNPVICSIYDMSIIALLFGIVSNYLQITMFVNLLQLSIVLYHFFTQTSNTVFITLYIFVELYISYYIVDINN